MLSNFDTWKTDNFDMEQLPDTDEDVVNDKEGCSDISLPHRSAPLFLYVCEPLKDQIYTSDYLKKVNTIVIVPFQSQLAIRLNTHSHLSTYPFVSSLLPLPRTNSVQSGPVRICANTNSIMSISQ